MRWWEMRYILWLIWSWKWNEINMTYFLGRWKWSHLIWRIWTDASVCLKWNEMRWEMRWDDEMVDEMVVDEMRWLMRWDGWWNEMRYEMVDEMIDEMRQIIWSIYHLIHHHLPSSSFLPFQAFIWSWLNQSQFRRDDGGIG